VPLTKPWFAGIANIRGNLYSVVDLSAFIGKEATPQNTSSRLLLIGTRHGSNAALLVTRMIGLRNVEALNSRSGCARRRPGHPKPIRTTKDVAGANSRCENCWLTRRSWTLAFEPLAHQGILDTTVICTVEEV
jgi:hypothetical protein